MNDSNGKYLMNKHLDVGTYIIDEIAENKLYNLLQISENKKNDIDLEQVLPKVISL